MKIIFYDVTAPIAYTGQTFAGQAVRGTEGSLIRVAHGLAETHGVYVAQRCRDDSNEVLSDGVHYISLETARHLSPDVVILLRDQRYLKEVIEYFPRARRFFWMHNMPARNFFKMRHLLNEYEVICVSHFHKQQIEKRLSGKWFQRLFKSRMLHKAVPVHVLYNPLAKSLKPDKSSINAQQMIFTSSPYKGLKQVLKIFALVRERYPEYELLITANPADVEVDLPDHVRCIGALPHQQLIQCVRESFCVFYPQSLRVETFGLVYAEANAVGTPVLAHDFGAAQEVLSDDCQLVDGHNMDAILSKISEWRNMRPVIEARPAFKLNRVMQAWLQLLQDRSAI